MRVYLIGGMLLLLLAQQARAQSQFKGTDHHDVSGVGLECLELDGYVHPCGNAAMPIVVTVASGGGGGGGGTVTLGGAQQTLVIPALPNPVPVSAATTTPIWTYAAATTILTLSLSCPSGGVLATANGSGKWLVFTGYEFTPGGSQVPTQGLTLTCPTAASVYVAQGHP